MCHDSHDLVMSYPCVMSLLVSCHDWCRAFMSCSEGAMPIFVLLTSVLLAVDERQSETL